MADLGGSASADVGSDGDGGGLSDVAMEALEGGGGEGGAEEIPSSSVDDSAPPPQDSVRDPKTGKFAKKGDATAPKRYTLKAHGREYQAKDEAELIAIAQRGLAIQQNTEQERAQIRQMREQLRAQLDKYEAAEKDPAAWLRKLDSKKAEDIAEQLLLERVAEAQLLEQMTPRERKLYEEKKVAEAQLKEHNERQRVEAEKQETALVEQQKQQFDQLFTKALTDNKLPANPLTIRVMSAVARAALSRGVDVTQEQLVTMTRQQLRQISDASFGSISAADFIQAYPKLAEDIRKHQLSELHKGRGSPGEVQNVPRQPRATVKAADVPDKDTEWDRYVEKLKKDGNVLRVKNGWG